MLNIKLPTISGSKQKGYYRRNYYDNYVIRNFVEHAYCIINQKEDCIIAKNNISFGEIPFGTKFNDVIKKKGTPKYNLTKKQLSFSIDILIYKEKIGGNKKISTFYFIDNILIAGEHKFSEINNEDTQFLKKMLLKKYEVEREISIKEFYLKKEKSACIYFSHGFYVSIFYISLDDNHVQILIDEINKKENLKKIKLAQKESDLLKNL